MEKRAESRLKHSIIIKKPDSQSKGTAQIVQKYI